MSVWISGASRAVGWWTATYTAGLASSVRDARRAEIASDVWEHSEDIVAGGETLLGSAIGVVSRMVRGVPADLLWRVNVEGPKMDIRIPFERITGALLLAMVVLVMITGAISGYDTSADSFEGELLRLADLGPAADNGNAFFRIATGLALIGAAAGFYVSLRERSPLLATIAAFGLMAAAVLELVASGLQMVFVQLANEYVDANAADKPTLLVNARTVAITVEHTSGAAFVSLVLSTYVLAVLAGREALVPRWLIGIPVMSAVLVTTALIAGASGVGGDGWRWIWLMSGMFTSVLWLLIAGLWLLFTPRQDKISTGPAQPAAA
jgi:hypothetical protein